MSLIVPDLPDEVQWAAVLVESEVTILEASPLLSSDPDGRFSASISSLAKDGTSVYLAGYASDPIRAMSQELGVDVSEFPVAPRVDASEPVVPGVLWAGQGEWSERGVIDFTRVEPRALTTDWLPRCTTDPCALMGFEGARTLEIDEPAASRVVFAVPWDVEASAALVFVDTSSGSAAYRVTGDEVSAEPVAIFDEHLAHGAIDEDGVIWLVDPFGSVLFGHPDTGFSKVAATLHNPSTPERRVAAGTMAGKPDVYVISRSGDLERFDGESWTLLADAQVGGGNGTDVARLGPGRVVALYQSSSTILVLEGGELIESRAVPEPKRVVNTEFGTFVTSVVSDVFDGTEIYKRIGDTWEIVLEVGTDQGYGARGIWALDEGLLYGGTLGQFKYYYPGLGVCPGGAYAEDGVNSVVALSSGQLVLAGAARPIVTIIDRGPIPVACEP